MSGIDEYVRLFHDALINAHDEERNLRIDVDKMLSVLSYWLFDMESIFPIGISCDGEWFTEQIRRLSMFVNSTMKGRSNEHGCIFVFDSGQVTTQNTSSKPGVVKSVKDASLLRLMHIDMLTTGISDTMMFPDAVSFCNGVTHTQHGQKYCFTQCDSISCRDARNRSFIGNRQNQTHPSSRGVLGPLAAMYLSVSSVAVISRSRDMIPELLYVQGRLGDGVDNPIAWIEAPWDEDLDSEEESSEDSEEDAPEAEEVKPPSKRPKKTAKRKIPCRVTIDTVTSEMWPKLCLLRKTPFPTRKVSVIPMKRLVELLRIFLKKDKELSGTVVAAYTYGVSALRRADTLHLGAICDEYNPLDVLLRSCSEVLTVSSDFHPCDPPATFSDAFGIDSCRSLHEHGSDTCDAIAKLILETINRVRGGIVSTEDYKRPILALSTVDSQPSDE